MLIATTSTSNTLSLTAIGLLAIPTSTATACGLSIGNKIFQEVILNEYNQHKKHNENDQQAIKSFNRLYRKSLKDKVIDKSEYESLYNMFTK